MRSRAKVVGLAVLAAGVLATSAWAEGGFSIGVRLPFGQRSRHDAGRRSRYARPDFRPSTRGYRYLPRYGRQGDERPVISFGYTQRWGDEREVGRDGRQARESVRDLIVALRRGSTKERERAAKELGRLPLEDVVEALIDSLLGDPDKNVRKEAARSLGNLSAEEARPALRHAARYDSSSRVRKAAEDALKKLGPEPYRRPFVYRQDPLRYTWPDDRYRDRYYDKDEIELEKRLRELGSRDKGERKKAAEKLGKLGDRRAVPALIQAMRNDPEEDVREEAAEALGKIGDRSALPALRWAARHDREDDVREEAEDAIEEITD